MTGGVDQVDQEVVADGLLALDVLGILRLGEGGVQGDGSRLDGDTTCLGSAHLSLPATLRTGREPGDRTGTRGQNIRSCSSARVSVARASPAFPVEMIPALASRESVRVDLPWST